MQKLLKHTPLLIGLSLLMCKSVGAQAPEQLFTDQPTVTPELAKSGEHAVGVRTLELTNPAQRSAADLTKTADRDLTVELWYPAKVTKTDKKAIYSDQTRSGKAFSLQGKAVRQAPAKSIKSGSPLVVLSHGYTGYRSQFFALGEHLASHGYTVASIDHTESTNADIDFNKDPGAGFFSTLLNRARDQQFVLDTLSSSAFESSTAVDPTRAAVLGYSMGGYGALNTVGGCYDFPNQVIAGFGLSEEQIKATQQVLNICNAGRVQVDPRWRAYVVIAPWGGENNIHTPSSLANIEIPGLFIAGELDDVVGFENGVAKLFNQTTQPQSSMLVFENARHNIGAHPAPQVAYDNDFDIGHYFEPAWNSETVTRVSNHMVLAFLNCHVRANARDCDYLPTRESSDQLKKTDGKLTPAWPGFTDRWATGLRFIRKDSTE